MINKKENVPREFEKQETTSFDISYQVKRNKYEKILKLINTVYRI